MTVIEVFADVACPFTHVGLRRLVEQRRPSVAHDVHAAGPGLAPRDRERQAARPAFIYEEVVDIRDQVAPDLFAGFREDALPASSMPALALTAAAYRLDMATGERVSLRSGSCCSSRASTSPTRRCSRPWPPSTASRPRSTTPPR